MKQEFGLPPLCVDLDGTLIHSDLLLETLLLLLKRNPFYFFLLPVWLLNGKAELKAKIAKRIVFNPAALPYNHLFLGWLQNQSYAERDVWLCTASNYRLAYPVAEYLQIFSGVLASTDDTNLSGSIKAKQLIEKFGEKGFDYCGNHRVDLAVWQVSQSAIVVNCSDRLTRDIGGVADIGAIFPKPSGILRSMLKALRPHHWAKNLLVFVPLAAAHKISEGISVEYALLAFLAFNLCASSVYLLNDLLDLEADRQHPRKCRRPFASGDLPLCVGFMLIPLLLLGAALSAMHLPARFLVVLGGYYALTISYSLSLKRIVLVDIITLAELYSARIVAGAMAINVRLSVWLLLFSFFLFLSLALLKRYAELDDVRRQGKLKAAGRGYHIKDLPILHGFGTASGYFCVLILVLYIHSPAINALYRHPQFLEFLCLLLPYWISRVWLKAYRGAMHDDPVIFAMKDRISLLILVFSAITICLAV